MIKFTIAILLLALSCASQTKIKTQKTETTVCWSAPDGAPEGIRYVLLYRKYQVNDSTWKYLADGSANIQTIQRPFFGKAELGVASIYGGDTSEIHSSLDSTACLRGGCDDVCEETGPWYIYFAISGPKFIAVRE